MSGTVTWGDALWLARHRTPNDRLRFWGSAVSSAITAAVLCTAIGLLMIGGSTYVPVNVGVVADPGTRGGVALAVALVALPAIHLTGQAWRLGSVEQRQRFRQLRDAGAGPRELRRVAVAGACVPVFGGAVLGVLVWGAVLVLVNGGLVRGPDREGLGAIVLDASKFTVQQVPNVVTDTPWAPAVAVIAVTLAAGSSAARSASRAAQHTSSRWSPLARVAASAAGSVTHPALLMALRRVGQEPRATARPALLLGLAGIVAGSSTWLYRQFELSLGTRWAEEPYWEQSFALVRLATVVGISLCGFGLVVVLAEATIRRRREDAAAVAGGVPLSILRQALVLQAMIPAAPVILVGLVVGAVGAMALTGLSAVPHSDERVPTPVEVPVAWPWLGWATWGVALIVAAAVASLMASTALRRTTRVDQLRVPA